MGSSLLLRDATVYKGSDKNGVLQSLSFSLSAMCLLGPLDLPRRCRQTDDADCSKDGNVGGRGARECADPAERTDVVHLPALSAILRALERVEQLAGAVGRHA